MIYRQLNPHLRPEEDPAYGHFAGGGGDAVGAGPAVSKSGSRRYTPVTAYRLMSGLPPPIIAAAIVRRSEAAMAAGSPVPGSRLAAMDG